MQRNEERPPFGRFPRLRGHRCLDVSRRDGVDAHAERPEGDGVLLGEARHAMLGRHVGAGGRLQFQRLVVFRRRGADQAHQPSDGGRIYDRAAALFGNERRAVEQTVRDAGEIHADDLIPGQVPAADPGVVEKNLQPAQLRRGVLQCFDHRALLCDVESLGRRPAALLLNHGRGARGTFLIQVRAHDRRAFRRHAQRAAASDAARRPGDQRDPFVQSSHVVALW